MIVHSLSDGFGSVVRTSHAFEIPRPELVALLKQSGVLLFQETNFDLSQFEAFSDLFGTTKQGAHPSLHGKSREVTTGRDVQALHSEFFLAPCISPDLVWFYCERPAMEGGGTTVADGIRFLAELGGGTRDLFQRNRLRYHFIFGKEIWESLLASRHVIAELCAHFPELSNRFSANDALHLDCTMSAIKKTKFGEEEAFVNPVMHAFQFPKFYRLFLEDGSSIPQEIATDLETVARQVTLTIAWNAGDFALIDNTRVMHGRKAFSDPRRKILARHAMALF